MSENSKVHHARTHSRYIKDQALFQPKQIFCRIAKYASITTTEVCSNVKKKNPRATF